MDWVPTTLSAAVAASLGSIAPHALPEVLRAATQTEASGGQRGQSSKAVSSVQLLFVSAAQRNVPAKDLEMWLRGPHVGVGEGEAEMVAGAYGSVVESWREKLWEVWTGIAKVTDVRWRLVHRFGGSSGDRGDGPEAMEVQLSIQIQPKRCHGGAKELNIVCSIAELEDFLSKVKEANRQISRLVQS